MLASFAALRYPYVARLPSAASRQIQQAYLFKAALSELRTLLSLRTRNGQASVRSLTLSAEREVEGLGDRIKEGVEQLKHESVTFCDRRI